MHLYPVMISSNGHLRAKKMAHAQFHPWFFFNLIVASNMFEVIRVENYVFPFEILSVLWVHAVVSAKVWLCRGVSHVIADVVWQLCIAAVVVVTTWIFVMLQSLDGALPPPLTGDDGRLTCWLWWTNASRLNATEKGNGHVAAIAATLLYRLLSHSRKWCVRHWRARLWLLLIR